MGKQLGFKTKKWKFVKVVLISSLVLLPTISLLHISIVRFSSFKLALIIFTFLLISSVIAYVQVKRDKKKAQAGMWRISEANLHLLELLGGWPGSWIAQRRFRHKIAKRSYQMVFWFIVFAYQFWALDYLLEGMIMSAVWEFALSLA